MGCRIGYRYVGGKTVTSGKGGSNLLHTTGPMCGVPSRETTQPDREALVYWAEGLSGTYLEGAMARTLTKIKVTVRELPTPLFDGPEVSPRVEVIRNRRATEVDRAVLDPFSVGAKGEDLLRSELGALRDWHLRNIIRAYDLAAPSVDVEQLTARQLIEVIVAAVQPV